MQIDPRVSFWFGVWTSILLLVATTGTNFFDGALPAWIIPPVVKWCAILGAINSTILTAANGYSSSKPGPLVNAPPKITPTIVKVLLVAFLLSAFLAAPSAQAQVRRPALTGNPVYDIKNAFERQTGVKATGDVPFDLLRALDKALLPDLQYALKLAQATGSKVTAPCYSAWIDMINTQQTAVQTKNADGTTAEIAVPDPHLVTDFERMVELRNALQPDSAFMTACSPVANMVKMDVTHFMGIVISGGAGLATLVPGL